MATASRSDRQRGRVLEAAIAAIAEVGVDSLRMSDISERAGMTPGHILYYFGRKERILIETLRWSEHDLADKRRLALGREPDPRDRLRTFVDHYLPVGTVDPRWNLWLQVGIHPPGDDETRELFESLIDLWRDDLIDLAREGLRDGIFAQPEVGLDAFASRGLWFLDGLSLAILSGSPRLTRSDAVEIGFDELERRLLASGNPHISA